MPVDDQVAKWNDYLHNLYYDKKMMLGRDRLYKYIQAQRPDLVAAGLSRRHIMKWLKAQEVHQLFFPVRNMPQLQRTIATAPFAVVALDLIDMHNHAVDGYHWAFTAIDLFSKRAYAVPLKDKTAVEVIKGLALMLFGNTKQLRFQKKGVDDMSQWTITKHTVKPTTVVAPQMTQHPHHFRSDNGSEFKNALFTTFLRTHTVREDNNTPTTQHFSLPSKPQSNGGIERFNKFLKQQIRMCTVQHNDNDWPRMLPTILENYNMTWCRVTNQTPLQVEADYVRTHDAEAVRQNIIRSVSKANAKVNGLCALTFHVGEIVRVRLHWAKSAGLNWSRQLYKIERVIQGHAQPVHRHIQYKLQACQTDDNADLECDTPISGIYYNDQLQPYTPLQGHVEGAERYVIHHLIKPVLKKQDNEWVQMYEVRWVGYKGSTTEPRATLVLDVPKLVSKFERQHNVQWLATTQPTWTKK